MNHSPISKIYRFLFFKLSNQNDPYRRNIDIQCSNFYEIYYIVACIFQFFSLGPCLCLYKYLIIILLWYISFMTIVCYRWHFCAVCTSRLCCFRKIKEYSSIFNICIMHSHFSPQNIHCITQLLRVYRILYVELVDIIIVVVFIERLRFIGNL